MTWYDSVAPHRSALREQSAAHVAPADDDDPRADLGSPCPWCSDRGSRGRPDTLGVVRREGGAMRPPEYPTATTTASCAVAQFLQGDVAADLHAELISTPISTRSRISFGDDLAVEAVEGDAGGQQAAGHAARARRRSLGSPSAPGRRPRPARPGPRRPRRRARGGAPGSAGGPAGAPRGRTPRSTRGAAGGWRWGRPGRSAGRRPRRGCCRCSPARRAGRSGGGRRCRLRWPGRPPPGRSGPGRRRWPGSRPWHGATRRWSWSSVIRSLNSRGPASVTGGGWSSMTPRRRRGPRQRRQVGCSSGTDGDGGGTSA